MAKNLVLGLILASLAQIWAQKIFFRGFYFKYMLDIVGSYHSMRFQGKIMNQSEKIVENLVSGQILACFGSNLVPNFFCGFHHY